MLALAGALGAGVPAHLAAQTDAASSDVSANVMIPAVPAPLGQALPDLAFYEALAPDLPGLQPVYAAVRAKNVAAAQRAFAAYLRGKTYNSAALDVHPRKSAGHATTPGGEAAAATRITLLGHTQDYKGSIDWTKNPTTFADWLLMLNRHVHWADLAEAYRQTGNPRYTKAFVAQFDSWMKGAPLPGVVVQTQARQISREHGHRRPFAPAWRTIEVGERLRAAWPKALGAFLQDPALDDATLVRFVAAMARQADFLVEFQGPQNWYYIESEGLLRVAALFPEFSRAQVWRDEAIGRIERQLRLEVYPDGAHEELTFWYHETVRSAAANMLGLATKLGFPPSDETMRSFERMHEAMMASVQPDGRLPQVNDSDSLPAAYILQDGARRFGRSDMVYVASRTRSGDAPDFLSKALPWAGWAAMRSGWSDQDNFLFFEAGPFGGHAHEDKLGFILFGHGESFVIDTGRSAYGESAQRSFNIGPKAHSTVLFDGKGQSRRFWRDGRLMRTKTEAEGFAFATTESVDFATGAFGEQTDEFFYDAALGYAFMEQRRVVLYLKPDRWVVLDTFKERSGHSELDQNQLKDSSYAPARATTLFQLNDLPLELKSDAGHLTLGRTDAPRLNLSWTLPEQTAAKVVRGQETPELMGWRFLGMREGNRAEPTPTLVLDRPLQGKPGASGYLFSVAKTNEATRDERIVLTASEADGHVFELRNASGVFAEIKLNADASQPFTWKGEQLNGRVVIEWKGERRVFP